MSLPSFRAQARHIGKIVIEQTDGTAGFEIRADGAYLVTGAFGGLGLEVARWLSDRGAGRLILVGRRAPQDAAEARKLTAADLL